MFTPDQTVLATVYEGTEFEYTIKYTDGVTEHPVTITPSVTNPYVTILGNKISGFFRHPFNDDVQYKSGLDVQSADTLRGVPEIDRQSIFSFTADPAETITFHYTASANNETKLYQIIVNNNLSSNRNRLMSFLKTGGYKEITATWKNNNNNSVVWINRWNERTDWNEDIWPWQ